MANEMTRRNVIKSAAGAAAAVALSGGAVPPVRADETATPPSAAAPGPARRGNIHHSACQWCYPKDWTPEIFCQNAQKLGMYGIDLVGPDWFPTLKKYNLVGTMTTTHSIPKGLNRKENWDECLGKIRAAIEATSDAGFPNVICFSGNRDGMDDDEGLRNCAAAL